VPRPSLKALIASAVGALLLLALVFWPRTEVLSLAGATMGTQWQVQLVDDGEGELEGLATEIETLLRELDLGVFSTWAAESELSRLNRASGSEPLPASPALLQVLQSALRIHAESDGAFDPSVGALVNLWGFGPVAITASPEPAAIAEARSLLGAQELQLDLAAGTVSKPAGMQLDLSGIAKGYAVDRVAELLLTRGFSSFIVEIGGELRVQGVRPDDSAWTIAIEQPEPELRAVQALFDTKGEPLALAGSGDYRNYRIIEGVRQSHEIDPLRGIPVQHGLAAVTVLATTAMDADAWATALMVLGPSDGMRVADRLGLSAYFIIRDGDAWQVETTGRFADYLVETDSKDIP
jgi:thiamine biosynthesis lipoprotein